MILSLLLITYYLLLVVLAWRNLKWAIYLVCFTLPAYLVRFQIGPIPMTVLEGEILILFLVWILKYVTTPADCCRPPLLQKEGSLRLLYYSITLLLVISAISIFISPSLRSAAGIWRAYFLEPLLFFIVFINVIKREDLKNIFWSLSSSAFLLSLFAIYQKFTGAFISNPFWADAATRRVTSVFPYPNALALFLAPVVVILIGLLVLEFRKKNFTLLLYYFITFITAFLAVYFTKSKGAMLAILAGLIFYAIFFKGKRKFFIGILAVAFLSLFLFFLFFPGNPANMLKGNSTVAGGDSISTRIDMWSETWQMLKTRPILGAGLAGYQAAVAPFHQKSYIEVYLYPHNIILNFWSEIGLFGLLAFLGIVIWCYKSVFSCHPKFISGSGEIPKQVRNDNGGGLLITHYSLLITLLAALTALLVHGLVDVPYFKNDLSVLFWILIASMFVLCRSREGGNQE